MRFSDSASMPVLLAGMDGAALSIGLRCNYDRGCSTAILVAGAACTDSANTVVLLRRDPDQRAWLK
jgi:hypothetical protein